MSSIPTAIEHQKDGTMNKKYGKVSLGDCEMPEGRVVLSYKITGGGWNGKCERNFSDEIGTWRAFDAGDVTDPESQVTVSVKVEGWGKKVRCSRNQVESMFNGEMGVIGDVFYGAAIAYNEKNPGSQIEILDIKPQEEPET